MEAIKTLEDILEKKSGKKGNKLNNEEKKSVVEALLKLSSQRENYEKIVEFLYKFHYSVSGDFFEKFSTKTDAQNISAFSEILTGNKQFKEGKTCSKASLSAALVLANQKKYEESFFILKSILKQSDKNGLYTDASLHDFKTVTANKDGMQYIDKMIEQIETGEVPCSELEKKRLDRFRKALQDKAKTENEKVKPVVSDQAKMQEPSPVQEEKVLEKNADAPDNTREEETREPKKELIPDPGESTEKKFDQIDKNQKEILAAIQKLSQNQSTMESLSASIARRDEEIITLKTNLTEREKRISSLVNDAYAKEKELTMRNQQIEDLTERLRVSMQMDDITKNQEVLTLKNDISEALKLDYSDFIKSKEKPCDEDLFEAYRLTLSRIFKLLKRFGIDCQ